MEKLECSRLVEVLPLPQWNWAVGAQPWAGLMAAPGSQTGLQGLCLTTDPTAPQRCCTRGARRVGQWARPPFSQQIFIEQLLQACCPGGILILGREMEK